MKKIESAKAWFVLANLFMLLSGFMFAAAGITYSNAVSGLDSGFYALSQTKETYSNNLTDPNCDTWINVTSNLFKIHSIQFELWPLLLQIAAIIAGLSFLSWGMGKFNLWRLAKNE